MICKTKAELQQEFDTGRALISLRASLMESLAEDIELGTDTIAESIRSTLQFFAGTNHALHTSRANAARLLGADQTQPSVSGFTAAYDTSSTVGDDDDITDTDLE